MEAEFRKAWAADRSLQRSVPFRQSLRDYSRNPGAGMEGGNWQILPVGRFAGILRKKILQHCSGTECRFPMQGRICGILFSMACNRSGCYRSHMEKPAQWRAIMGASQPISELRESMHLNIGQGFYFTPKLPFIAFALLLAEVRTCDRLPHLERPIENPVLPMQQWMTGYVVPAGLRFSNYFCCC